MARQPRLLLINPNFETTVGSGRRNCNLFPSLALAYLASYTPPHWETRIYDDVIEKGPLPLAADLVALTGYTASIPRAYAIAKFYREHGIPVVMGGTHVSYMVEEARAYADSIVVGEAESIWPQVVQDYEEGTLKPLYQGERLEMAGLRFPSRHLFTPKYHISTIQTARGCPYACEFCSVQQFNGRRMRYRPVAEVIEELRTIKHRRVVIVDDNIIGSGVKGRERAKELFAAMVQADLRKTWVTQTCIDFGSDSELIKLARRAGCVGVSVGIDSVSEVAWEHINKSMNLRHGVSGVAERVRKIYENGIAVNGCFIIGNDGDTRESILQMTHFIRACRFAMVGITWLTPLPGTALYRRALAEGRLKPVRDASEWGNFDTDHLVMDLGRYSRTEWQEIEYQFFKSIGSLPAILARMWANFRHFKNLLVPVACFVNDVRYYNRFRLVRRDFRRLRSAAHGMNFWLKISSLSLLRSRRVLHFLTGKA